MRPAKANAPDGSGRKGPVSGLARFKMPGRSTWEPFAYSDQDCKEIRRYKNTWCTVLETCNHVHCERYLCRHLILCVAICTSIWYLANYLPEDMRGTCVWCCICKISTSLYKRAAMPDVVGGCSTFFVPLKLEPVKKLLLGVLNFSRLMLLDPISTQIQPSHEPLEGSDGRFARWLKWNLEAFKAGQWFLDLEDINTFTVRREKYWL